MSDEVIKYVKLRELPSIVDIEKEVKYDNIKQGPTTKFYARCDGRAIVVEQEGQIVELEIEMIRELPKMAARWLTSAPSTCNTQQHQRSVDP